MKNIRYIGSGSGYIDLSKLDDFTILFDWSSKDSLVNSLKTLSNGSRVKDLTFSSSASDGFLWLKDLFEMREEELGVDILRFTRSTTLVSKLSDLSGLEYVDKLREFWVVKDVCNSIKDISALLHNAETLETISIPENSISDISILSNFSKLTYLDLENNSLAPYVEIKNESGTTKWFTIREICDLMRNNAKVGQVTLKLKGNSAITDWYEYTKDTSKWASGSSYGN